MDFVGTALAELTMPQISPLAGEPIERADAERLAGVLKALATRPGCGFSASSSPPRRARPACAT